MKFKKALTATLLTFSSLLPSTVQAQVNDNVSLPCRGNGWFTAGKAGYVYCSKQNNHIVIDVYNEKGERTQGAIDLWYGSQCDASRALMAVGYPFKLVLRNDGYGLPGQTGCGILGYYPSTVGQSVTSAHTVGEATRLHTCNIMPDYTCNYLEGFIDLRPTGINNGPPVVFGVFGHGDKSVPSTYTLTIAIYLENGHE